MGHLKEIASDLERNVYKDPMHGQIAKLNFEYGVAQAKMALTRWLKDHIHEYIAVGNTDYGKPYDIHLCSEELFEDLDKALEE